MKAIRCGVCALLVKQDGDVGSLVVAIPGNHEPREIDGYALPSETPVCEGSEMLGMVTEAASCFVGESEVETVEYGL